MQEEIKKRIEMIQQGEVPEGYKKTRLGIVPIDWDVKHYEQVADITSSKRIYATDYTNDGIPFYRSKEIIEKINNMPIENVLYISSTKYYQLKNKYGSPCKGDILLTAVGSLGFAYLVDDEKDFYFKDGNLLWFKNINNVDNRYLKVTFNSSYFVKQIEEIFSGSSQRALTIEKVNKLNYLHPLIEEQHKIVSILSTWDRAIELKEHLIEQKKQLKKGLMQNLLTGKVRLPSFEGEWEEITIKEVFNISTGYSKRGYINENGKYYIADMGAISREGELIATKKTDHNIDMLKHGDLVMAKDDIGGGNIIGRVIFIDKDDKYVLGDHVFKLKPLYGNPLFYTYLLNSKGYNKIFRRNSIGTAQLGLPKKDIENIKIFKPSLEEQNAIANILRNCDKNIEKLMKELKLLKQQKKGLMQLLLTGIVRVPEAYDQPVEREEGEVNA